MLRPLPKPKRPERLPKPKPVTIALGFQFNDGLLFAADTKITTDVKTNQSKIAYFRSDYCAVTFALAGVLPYARSAIEKCEMELCQVDFLNATFDDVQNALEKALTQFYQMHVHPNPESRDFGLLIGVWLKGKSRFFSSYESTLHIVQDSYECLGTGAYLARYWIRQFLASEGTANSSPRTLLPENLSLKEASLIVEYALDSVMEYDESCGGEAEFFIMKSNGEMGDLREYVYPSGSFASELQRSTWRLLRKLVQAEDKADTEIAIDEFGEAVREANKAHAGLFELIKGTIKSSNRES
jgi:20S proteasome alpha/beta subunit